MGKKRKKKKSPQKRKRDQMANGGVSKADFDELKTLLVAGLASAKAQLEAVDVKFAAIDVAAVSKTLTEFKTEVSTTLIGFKADMAKELVSVENKVSKICKDADELHESYERLKESLDGLASYGVVMVAGLVAGGTIAALTGFNPAGIAVGAVAGCAIGAGFNALARTQASVLGSSN